MKRHVLISGTGRAGTTFLMQLLTNLGLDTGFTEKSIKNMPPSRGALEVDEATVMRPNAPYILKRPQFCDALPEKITIDHLFVPIRDLEAAAESRRQVAQTYGKDTPGALWYTSSMKAGDQEDVLLRKLYKLIYQASKRETPVTFIHYPTLTRDSTYLYGKLKPILKEITLERFREVFTRTVRPGWVHPRSPTDR